MAFRRFHLRLIKARPFGTFTLLLSGIYNAAQQGIFGFAKMIDIYYLCSKKL
jgi:hypothetical protein